jgi:hypothetical protein
MRRNCRLRRPTIAYGDSTIVTAQDGGCRSSRLRLSPGKQTPIGAAGTDRAEVCKQICISANKTAWRQATPRPDIFTGKDAGGGWLNLARMPVSEADIMADDCH